MVGEYFAFRIGFDKKCVLVGNIYQQNGISQVVPICIVIVNLQPIVDYLFLS